MGGFKSFLLWVTLDACLFYPYFKSVFCLFLLTAHFDIPWSCVSLEVEHY